MATCCCCSMATLNICRMSYVWIVRASLQCLPCIYYNTTRNVCASFFITLSLSFSIYFYLFVASTTLSRFYVAWFYGQIFTHFTDWLSSNGTKYLSRFFFVAFCYILAYIFGSWSLINASMALPFWWHCDICFIVS